MKFASLSPSAIIISINYFKEYKINIWFDVTPNAFWWRAESALNSAGARIEFYTLFAFALYFQRSYSSYSFVCIRSVYILWVVLTALASLHFYAHLFIHYVICTQLIFIFMRGGGALVGVFPSGACDLPKRN